MLRIAATVFNPALPLDGSLMEAGEMRDQFNGLKALIDSVPAGPQGPEDPQGPQGAWGPAGPAGVSELSAAIATTATDPDGIAPYGGSFSDPLTQGEMQAFAS